MRIFSKAFLVAGMTLLSAGCSSTDDGSNTLSNLFFFNKSNAPSLEKAPTEAVYCPQIDIADGGAYTTIGRGGQASISDIARECHVRDDGSVIVKVGVGGRVVLASASGGRYSVPVVFRIKAGDKVIAQKSQAAAASTTGDLSGEFAVVQEGLIVPAAYNQNFDIEVSLGGGRGHVR